jgi:hypothetical protein
LPRLFHLHSKPNTIKPSGTFASTIINLNQGGYMPYSEDSFVRIMKCRFCQKETNAIALNRRLKPIKEDVYDFDPCDKCKELFKTHRYFIGDCGHSGFIKEEAFLRASHLEQVLRLKDHKIFRMTKCFLCIHNIDPESTPKA